MTAETNLKERTRLHNWIDELPPRRFELVYRLVEELIEGEMDETENTGGFWAACAEQLAASCYRITTGP